MKICFVSPGVADLLEGKKKYGGAEVQIYLIAKYIGKEAQKLGQTVETYLITKSTKIKRLGETKVVSERFSGRKRFFFTPLRIANFIRLLGKISPDVIYLRSVRLEALLCLLWAKAHEKKFVFALPSNLFASPQTAVKFFQTSADIIISTFLPILIRYSDMVLVQNKEQKRMIEKNFMRRDTKIVESLVEIPRKIPGFEKRDKIVWIGRNAPVKKPEIFVKIAQMTNVKDEFVMVGRGLESFGKHVKVLGYIPHGKISQVLMQAKVLVNTSEGEGFPSTFVEAWAHGVPVASVKVNPDGLLTKRKLGFVGPPEKISRWLERICTSPKLWTEYSKRVRKHAIENHSPEKVSRKLLEIFRLIAD